MKANSAFLICSFLVIKMNYKPDDALKLFMGRTFKPFIDSVSDQSSFNLTIVDFLYALHFALKMNWYNPKTFNYEEYESYSKIENGELNWIIPNKFALFSTPIETVQNNINNQYNPKFYSDIFKKLKIYTVIRVNGPINYDKEKFISEGINHYDLNVQHDRENQLV